MIFSTLWQINNENSQNVFVKQRIRASFKIAYFEAESPGIHCEWVTGLGPAPKPLVSSGSGVGKAVLEPVQRRILESYSFLRLSSVMGAEKGSMTLQDYSREIVVRRWPVYFSFFHIGWVGGFMVSSVNNLKYYFYFELIIQMLNLLL